MSAKKQTSPEPHSSDREPSNNRRNLLKAAASMAPFVGTLPSGAALANASSVQCALNIQLEAAQQRPTQARAEPDNYYRVPAKTWTQRPFGDLYQFTPLGGTEEVRVNLDGEKIPIPPPPNDQPPPRAKNVYLLILYVPKDDPLTALDLEDDGVTPASCNIPSGKGFPSGTPVSPGTYCIHPIANLEGTAFGNMGMTQSCLTSFVQG